MSRWRTIAAHFRRTVCLALCHRSHDKGTGSTTTDVFAGTTKKTAQGTDKAASFASEGTALDCRYGQIGISAVAAAVRYQGDVKNPAYAPVATRQDVRFEEAA
jgi:hypothetical protein